MDRISAKIQEYHASARDIARHTERGYLSAILKMMTARLLHDQGPVDFWWYQLDRVPLSQMGGYISIGEYGDFMALLNPIDKRYLANNKVEFYCRCRDHQLATPEVLAVITPEPYSTPLTMPNLTSAEALWQHLTELEPGGYILKPIDGAEGRGVMPIRTTSEGVNDAEGKPLSDEALWQHCMIPGRRGPGFILQPQVSVHADLTPINPSSALGTVRLVTHLRPDRSIRYFMAFCRIPRAHSVLDSFGDGSPGNMTGILDIESGRLKCAIARTPDNPLLRDFERHPDTGTRFDGFTLPLWPDVLELAASAQRAFPEMRMIGWDVGITDNGPTLIEANAYFSHTSTAMVARRGTRADLEACYLETKAADEVGLNRITA